MSIKVNTTVTVTIGDVSATITAEEAMALRDALVAQFPYPAPRTNPVIPAIPKPPRRDPVDVQPWRDIQPWQVPKPPYSGDPIWCRTGRDPMDHITVTMND